MYETVVGLTSETIVRMAKDIKVSKPKNYNPDIVVHILNEYEDDTIDYGAEEAPNILIVMNESFSDLQKCYEIELSADPIETYHSLLERENVISGMMHSSQFGGGTANIEWELLTLYPQSSLVIVSKNLL